MIHNRHSCYSPVQPMSSIVQVDLRHTVTLAPARGGLYGLVGPYTRRGVVTMRRLVNRTSRSGIPNARMRILCALTAALSSASSIMRWAISTYLQGRRVVGEEGAAGANYGECHRVNARSYACVRFVRWELSMRRPADGILHR